MSQLRHTHMSGVAFTALLESKGHSLLQITSPQYCHNLKAKERQHHAPLEGVLPRPSTAAISHKYCKTSARAGGSMFPPLTVPTCSYVPAALLRRWHSTPHSVAPTKLCFQGQHLSLATGRDSSSHEVLLVQLMAHTFVTSLND